MSKNKKIIWIIIIIAVVAGGYFYLQSKKPKTEYTTADVEKGDLAQTVSVTGTINRETQIDLSFKTSGRLEEINVSEGDLVKKGQRLARIDRAVLNSQYREAEQDIAYQKKTLANMKRRDDTYNSQQESAQKALIKKAIEAKNAIASQLGDTYLKSPIDGMVLKKNYDAGENITLNSAVITVADGELIIESKVPESDIVKIALDQNAEITFDALSQNDKFEGKIYEIDPASTVVQDVVYYKIKLRLSNIDQRFKPGMSCDIDVKTAEEKNVLKIPIRAIKTEGSQKFVDVLKVEDNTLEKKKVETGLEGDGGMVEIKSGLQAGEKVVTFVKNAQ